MTGSGPGKLNKSDVGWSAFESARWSAVISGAFYGMEAFGYQLREALPWFALSFPMDVTATLAVVSFVLIFVAKLWNRRRSDNRPGRER